MSIEIASKTTYAKLHVMPKIEGVPVGDQPYASIYTCGDDHILFVEISDINKIRNQEELDRFTKHIREIFRHDIWDDNWLQNTLQELTYMEFANMIQKKMAGAYPRIIIPHREAFANSERVGDTILLDLSDASTFSYPEARDLSIRVSSESIEKEIEACFKAVKNDQEFIVTGVKLNIKKEEETL